jgi:transposase
MVSMPLVLLVLSAHEGERMPAPRLAARPPADPAEGRTLRKLAAARHAPASWIQRARIVVGSWDGATVTELAERLGCRTKTVSKWLHRFNAGGVDALGDLPRPGLPRRITETERGRIIQLARSAPPGRLVQGGEGLRAPTDPEAPATWTLDALAEAAQAEGIRIARSQVRRILLAEGARWRTTRSWTTSTDVDFVPKERPSSPATPAHRRTRR